MTTPLVTVANSIIEFILSLLRDPAALAELEKDPEAALVKNKVAGICAEDVRAVAPIIYDRPDVVPRSTAPASPPTHHNEVLNEITRITNNWTTIDSRSTIVDQSVNQNIWTEGGDVTQIFDQTAGVASGDGSMAAGDDIGVNTPVDDDTDEEPTLPDLPGLPDEGGLDDLVDADDELPPDDAGEPADGGDPQPTVPSPDVPPETAQDAVQDAIAVAGDVADDAEQAPAPVYDAPPAEVDDAVWSEPVDTVPVEEVVYSDDLSEEQ
ncbi:IniB N-terminal domain-containing protein [Microbacterium timonense]|uniref:IniB N-terminal domain-containing protein n=1 Tax=Microbacterium timonense TaxID=2086576 RepID=UPI000D114CEF|nr:IniB N-terminal domain-containing protein [Microbacterium timonense]